MGLKEFIYRKGTIGQTARHIGKDYLELKSFLIENKSIYNFDESVVEKKNLYRKILSARAMVFFNSYPSIYSLYSYFLEEELPWNNLIDCVIFIINTEAGTYIMTDFGSKTYFRIREVVHQELLKVGVPEEDLS